MKCVPTVMLKELMCLDYKNIQSDTHKKVSAIGTWERDGASFLDLRMMMAEME